VDTIGLLLTVLVTVASVQDRDAAKPLLWNLRKAFPKIKLACGLDRSDVDAGTGVVIIRAGKLAKAREVPLHPTASQALWAYARRRDQLCPAARTRAFFVNVRGSRLASRRVPEIFAQLDPVSTYWYLQAAPELLALAAGRLEDHLADLP
jgi:integrase/recombinase XerD